VRTENPKAAPQLLRVLIDRFYQKDVELDHIPELLGSLAMIAPFAPQMSLEDIHLCLHILGWKNIALDQNTLELAMVYFEWEGLIERCKRTGIQKNECRGHYSNRGSQPSCEGILET
jgi:hypothetical protein